MKKMLGLFLMALFLLPLVRGTVFYCGYVREIDAENYSITIEMADFSEGNPGTGEIVSFHLSEKNAGN